VPLATRDALASRARPRARGGRSAARQTCEDISLAGGPEKKFAYEVALIHLGLGEREEARAWLDGPGPGAPAGCLPEVNRRSTHSVGAAVPGAGPRDGHPCAEAAPLTKSRPHTPVLRTFGSAVVPCLGVDDLEGSSPAQGCVRPWSRSGSGSRVPRGVRRSAISAHDGWTSPPRTRFARRVDPGADGAHVQCTTPETEPHTRWSLARPSRRLVGHRRQADLPWWRTPLRTEVHVLFVPLLSAKVTSGAPAAVPAAPRGGRGPVPWQLGSSRIGGGAPSGGRSIGRVRASGRAPSAEAGLLVHASSYTPRGSAMHRAGRLARGPPRTGPRVRLTPARSGCARVGGYRLGRPGAPLEAQGLTHREIEHPCPRPGLAAHTPGTPSSGRRDGPARHGRPAAQVVGDDLVAAPPRGP
jgi:hypothetical protein